MMMNLRKKRLECNLTQTKLAKKVCVTQGAVWQWENGRTEPKVTTAAKLAKALGCTIDELMRGE